ncbi:MAG: hypothetical protein JW809_02110 [Pirellulales bacterium]|nr:hypothetical protein [Pirellulales bacterium]
MVIRCTCPACGQAFQVPDDAAGRRVKCPKCGGVFQLAVQRPAAETAREPGWFVRTTDEAQHGPMTKAELDAWARDDRLDEFCQVRRADWDHWKWVEEVYPKFASGEPVGSPLSESRLGACRDCGKTVSRRARNCPHCGCPSPAARGAERARSPDEGRGISNQGLLLGGLAAAVLVGVVVGGAYVAVRIWGAAGNVAESLDLVTQPLAPEPVAMPPAPPPGPAPLAADQIAAAKRQAAEAAARAVDERFARDYAAVGSLDQVKQYAELSRSLSEGRFDPLDPSQDQKPLAPREPYRSQFDALVRECMAYIDARVRGPVADFQPIHAAAQAWAASKRSPLEQQLLGGQLSP